MTENTLSRRRLLSTGLAAFALLNTAACTEKEPAGEKTDGAAEMLRAATTDLTGATTAVHWTGSFPSASPNRSGAYTADVAVAGTGALLGTLVFSGQTAEVMSLAGHTMLRAGNLFWSHGGADASRLGHFRGRWIVMHPGYLGFDLAARLQPAALLGGTAPGAAVTSGATTAEGSEVRWQDVTYLVAADRSGLVRVTTAGTAESPARLDLRPAALGDDDRAELFSRLRVEAVQLLEARGFGTTKDFAGQVPPAFTGDELSAIVADLDRDRAALRASATIPS
ncbi:hypothetical protein [Actinoplanes couchii]|uniref:Lipoprotein n=1 Tax=Actinoplanes couchii TaxID=403638 RepID=A0ABQ3XFW4_9ACTN|nr:hypothetical protein [Actinoplanes couchii]MDR6321681.1 hypothetical protein [Actinoplanes couchii]GID57363.1 hypothetical protein Aco03nite_057670 [Actinoplanes couchii]